MKALSDNATQLASQGLRNARTGTRGHNGGRLWPASIRQATPAFPHPVVERYYQELLSFLTRLVRDRDEAADLVQESYARLVAVERGGEIVAEPRALLYRTARNLLIDRHRRREVRGENVPENAGQPLAPAEERPAPPAFEPDVAVDAGRGTQALLDTIAALPLRCREAFMLHKFDGLPQAEVAARMGISVKMVERHIQLALKACRDCRRRLEGGAHGEAS